MTSTRAYMTPFTKSLTMRSFSQGNGEGQQAAAAGSDGQAAATAGNVRVFPSN